MSTPTDAALLYRLFDLTPINEPLRQEFHRALDEVLDRGGFAGGMVPALLEERLATYLGVEDVIAVSSGTAALTLMLLAAGLRAGDEVLIPSATFFATAEAIVHSGAVPVPVDVGDDMCIDVEATEAAITARTVAILGVDLYGQPARWDRLRESADRHGLLLFQDAAQSLGAELRGKPVGHFADAGALSFYPTKNLGALGDAGAVVTNRADIAEGVRLLRAHGQPRKNEHVKYGFTERMDAIQAAFLICKLSGLASAQERRSVLGSRYNVLLDGAGIRRPLVRDDVRHAFHLLTCLVPDRDRVRRALAARGVETGVHYPTPIHLQSAYEGRIREGQLPTSEAWARQTLSLPLHSGLAEGDVGNIVEELARCT